MAKIELPPLTPDEISERDYDESRLNRDISRCWRGDSFDSERANKVLRAFAIVIFDHQGIIQANPGTSFASHKRFHPADSRGTVSTYKSTSQADSESAYLPWGAARQINVSYQQSAFSWQQPGQRRHEGPPCTPGNCARGWKRQTVHRFPLVKLFKIKYWWRRRELNPRPKMLSVKSLHT